MGFNSVFRALQEIFPEVDIRILKAVAIEHPKDADAAVEVILFEVLPSTSSRPEASLPTIDNRDDEHLSSFSPLTSPHTPSDYQDLKHSSIGEIGTEQSFLLKHQGAAEETIASSSSKPGSVASEDADENYHTNAPTSDSTFLDEPLDASTVSNINGENDTDQLCVNTESREESSSAAHQEINVSLESHQDSHAASSFIIHEDTVISDCRNDVFHAAMKDFFEQVANDSYSSTLSDVLQSCLDSKSKAENSPAQCLLDSSTVHGEIADFTERATKDDFTSVNEYEKPGSSSSLENSSEGVFCDTEMVNVQEDSSSTTIVTRSGQICRIDLLEDAIEDAKNNKKTLFSAMETVIGMMKEVELQEKEAELAKEEAARGGIDILTKVEDLRQMLQHAREANDMHAGEVYGEKAILATEVRELQSRLITLSDERDKSLAILDEMSQTLEARLAAAEEMRIAAEKEKQEKEESARKALVEQELIMEKVVQESKRLQEEAEENSKLRDFLMDRGRVVDMLQGEIAVICKDVKLLKEKFDECIPISKSLSSSQTSCVLASSTSFYKGLISDWVPEQDQSSETPKRVSPASSVSIDHHLNNSPEKKNTSDDKKKELLDDEWDLFEDETQLYS
ncbi:Ubiquitin system component Cue [Macleaya cordata]|uniref:Ubiquitin system component Cue n=1 Tax=Macleaya cordata TaxID=56857 RepID=A0A200RBG9_MACCD|nr:Ubiquitin system component Cue [Macleaya cordata]